MLRVTLAPGDLDDLRIASRPAPMIELHTLMRGRPALPAPAGIARDHLELVRGVASPACAPGFLFPAAVDLEDATETVAATRLEAIRRDLADNDTAGYPLPAWTTDLVRPGRRGTVARHALRAALDDVASTYVEPRARFAAPEIAACTGAWRRRLADHGAAAVLGSLHPTVRLVGSDLCVELASGADVATSTGGVGIRIVPTLAGSPSVTVSSDGGAPLVLTCPVPLSARSVQRPLDRALRDLMGPSRAMLLAAVASGPDGGVRDLGRRTGLAPASASEHLAVLRRGGLVARQAAGPTSAHRLTPLGWSLVLRDQ